MQHFKEPEPEPGMMTKCCHANHILARGLHTPFLTNLTQILGTLSHRLFYITLFSFICHCVCDSVVVKHLVDSTTSREGEDKVQDSQDGLPRKFLNQHQIVHLKCILWNKTRVTADC